MDAFFNRGCYPRQFLVIINWKSTGLKLTISGTVYSRPSSWLCKASLPCKKHIEAIHQQPHFCAFPCEADFRRDGRLGCCTVPHSQNCFLFSIFLGKVQLSKLTIHSSILFQVLPLYCMLHWLLEAERIFLLLQLVLQKGKTPLWSSLLTTSSFNETFREVRS